MINLQKVEISTDSKNEEVIRNIHMILTTPRGTVPFDREFGIDWSVLDLPLTIAKGRLSVDYTEKIKRYEPRAKVRQITYLSGELGQLIPKVVIEID